jgi:hypothetical protein
MTVIVDDTNLKAIAAAIRAKTGSKGAYKPREMASAIESMSAGITEVAELPAESAIGALYKISQPCLVDVVYAYGKYVYRGVPGSKNFYYVKTKPTEDIAETSADGSITNPYYVEDENDVFFYIEGEWKTFTAMTNMPYKGTVTNATDATEAGYYAVLGTEPVYCEYVNKFDDVIWVRNGTAAKVSTLIQSTNFYTIPTKTTEGILKSDASSTAYMYYIEDENDVFLYNADWRSISYNFGTARGEITDIADATEDGYYILRKPWKRYTN